MQFNVVASADEARRGKINLVKCGEIDPALGTPSPEAGKAAVEALEAANILDCIECGACTYICPGRLHLVQSFRAGKQKINNAKAAAKAAAEAAAKAEAEKKEA